jgi:hypothetical protein
MLRHIHLEGVGPAPEMSVELAPRLNLITGDNGVGKTFLLDIAWWALTGDWGRSPAWPRPGASAPRIDYAFGAGEHEWAHAHGVYEFLSQDWMADESPEGLPEYLVLYAQIDGSFSVWDSARNAWSASRMERRRLRPPEEPFHFSESDLWNGLKKMDRVISAGLIQDWVLWQLQDSRAFRQLVEVLRVLSPGEQEVLRPGEPTRVSLEDVREQPTLEMPYGTVPLIFASAGVKRILGLAYLLVWAWQEHQHAARLLRQPVAKRVIFLMDEVEAHLHPRWQRLIVPALLAVMDHLAADVQVQLVATTHAPLVLASVEPVFDEIQDKLIHLCLDGREVRVEDVEWAKQGDAVNWLVSEAFGLRQARSKEAERAIEAAEAWMRGDVSSLPSDLASREAIHDELQRVLAGNDEFWPRWIVSEPTQRVGSRAR